LVGAGACVGSEPVVGGVPFCIGAWLLQLLDPLEAGGGACCVSPLLPCGAAGGRGGCCWGGCWGDWAGRFGGTPLLPFAAAKGLGRFWPGC
jgi:hypothetical protein